MNPVISGVVRHPASDQAVLAVQLMKDFIDTQSDRELVKSGATVGGADDKEQNAGVAVLMDAGTVKRELYARIQWARVQVRCIGPDLFTASRIGSHLYELLDDQKYLELTDFNGKRWFVHTMYVDVAPSQHEDSGETKESLLFATMSVGRDPIQG